MQKETFVKVLFISHDATRTGAPIVLLHFLEWLKKNSSVSFSIILGKGGELEDSFRKLAPVYIWYRHNASTEGFYQLMINKVKKKFFNPEFHKEKLIQQLKKENYNLIFGNTALSARIILELRQQIFCPALCYIHELEIVLQTYCRLDKFKQAQPFIDYYIFASESAKYNMIASHGVNASVSEVVYEAIPIANIKRPIRSRQQVLTELGLDEETFIVGGSGLVEWRKGADLFIVIAKIIQEHFPEHNNINFIWLGYLDDKSFLHINYDIKKAGLTGKVKFIGKKDTPSDYFQVFDLFLLTSREDTFPLVCLEAAVLGAPIICFEGAGGIPELLQKGGGVVVPYSDVYAVAKVIVNLSQDSLRLNRMKGEIQKIIKDYDISVTGSKLLNIIQNVASTN